MLNDRRKNPQKNLIGEPWPKYNEMSMAICAQSYIWFRENDIVKWGWEKTEIVSNWKHFSMTFWESFDCTVAIEYPWDRLPLKFPCKVQVRKVWFIVCLFVFLLCFTYWNNTRTEEVICNVTSNGEEDQKSFGCMYKCFSMAMTIYSGQA